jgi:shikimate dehydrogenase
MFNGTFEKLGLDCRYQSFNVSPKQLSAAVEASRVLAFAGFNVTSPHKVAIVPMLDAVSNEADEIGSVNTVLRNPRGLEGHNTDGEGAIRALREYGFELKGSKVLVIGAGGAARSIIHSFCPQADEIVILGRSLEKARAIADNAKGTSKTLAGPLSQDEFEKTSQRVGLIVNATPVETSKLMLEFGISMAASGKPWIFDLAYDTEPKGKSPARRIHPLELLVQQAALSYELWFDNPAPIELMRSILIAHNGADWR